MKTSFIHDFCLKLFIISVKTSRDLLVFGSVVYKLNTQTKIETKSFYFSL